MGIAESIQSPHVERTASPVAGHDRGQDTCTNARSALEFLSLKLTGMQKQDLAQIVAVLHVFLDDPKIIDSAVEALERPPSAKKLGEENPQLPRSNRRA